MIRVYVYMQPPGRQELVTLGRLQVAPGGVGEFTYSPELVAQKGWVPDPIHYPLRAQPFTAIRSNDGIPGFIRDAAPDGWGERVIACSAGVTTLPGVEYLLKSSNVDRAGSLLIGTSRKPPDSLARPPGLDRLHDFLAFADGFQRGDDLSLTARRAVRQRTSLGGARPKVTLLDGDRVVLAKPRDRLDLHDIPAIEHACLHFAASKGMRVATTRLHRGHVNVLLVDRFDRVVDAGGSIHRLPMLSALSLIDGDWRAAAGRERWRYAVVADEMRRRGVPVADLQELFMRMCFNALIGNDDDHPKNHAILFQQGQWRLAPLYDVVPSLDGQPPESLAMAPGKSGTLIRRDNLLSHASHFGHDEASAATVLDQVASWSEELAGHYAAHLVPEQAELAMRSVNAARLRG